MPQETGVGGATPENMAVAGIPQAGELPVHQAAEVPATIKDPAAVESALGIRRVDGPRLTRAAHLEKQADGLEAGERSAMKRLHENAFDITVKPTHSGDSIEAYTRWSDFSYSGVCNMVREDPGRPRGPLTPNEEAQIRAQLRTSASSLRSMKSEVPNANIPDSVIEYVGNRAADDLVTTYFNDAEAASLRSQAKQLRAQANGGSARE